MSWLDARLGRDGRWDDSAAPRVDDGFPAANFAELRELGDAELQRASTELIEASTRIVAADPHDGDVAVHGGTAGELAGESAGGTGWTHGLDRAGFDRTDTDVGLFLNVATPITRRE